jgi:hypothetical protein
LKDEVMALPVKAISDTPHLSRQIGVPGSLECHTYSRTVFDHRQPNILQDDIQHLLTKGTRLFGQLWRGAIGHMDETIYTQFGDLLGAMTAVRRRDHKGSANSG